MLFPTGFPLESSLSPCKQTWSSSIIMAAGTVSHMCVLTLVQYFLRFFWGKYVSFPLLSDLLLLCTAHLWERKPQKIEGLKRKRRGKRIVGVEKRNEKRRHQGRGEDETNFMLFSHLEMWWGISRWIFCEMSTHLTVFIFAFRTQHDAALFETWCGVVCGIWTARKTDLLTVTFVFTLALCSAEAGLEGK